MKHALRGLALCVCVAGCSTRNGGRAWRNVAIRWIQIGGPHSGVILNARGEGRLESGDKTGRCFRIDPEALDALVSGLPEGGGSWSNPLVEDGVKFYVRVETCQGDSTVYHVHELLPRRLAFVLERIVISTKDVGVFSEARANLRKCLDSYRPMDIEELLCTSTDQVKFTSLEELERLGKDP